MTAYHQRARKAIYDRDGTVFEVDSLHEIDFAYWLDEWGFDWQRWDQESPLPTPAGVWTPDFVIHSVRYGEEPTDRFCPEYGHVYGSQFPASGPCWGLPYQRLRDVYVDVKPHGWPGRDSEDERRLHRIMSRAEGDHGSLCIMQRGSTPFGTDPHDLRPVRYGDSDVHWRAYGSDDLWARLEWTYGRPPVLSRRLPMRAWPRSRPDGRLDRNGRYHRDLGSPKCP
jgi:hypothetical protein